MASLARHARRIVLHMDINKTVMMGDRAQGLSAKDTLITSLPDTTWGHVVTNDQEKTWKLYLSEKGEPYLGIEKKIENTVTYEHFLTEILFPSDSSLSREEFLSKQTTTKALRLSFTSAGQPGEHLCPIVEKTMASIDPNYALIPSFLRMLEVLGERKVDFKVIFRTFGTDMPIIAKDMNEFCKGRMSQFSHVKMDGTEGSPDLSMPGDTLESPQYARLIVDDSGNYSLIKGLVGPEDDTLRNLADFEAQGFEVVQGTEAIGREFSKLIQTDGVSGMRDDYQYWNLNKRDGRYGKLLLVDQQDETLFHVFFDDNINRNPEEGTGIVDVRNIRTWEPLENQYRSDRHVLIRAEPTLALTDTEWFIKQLEPFL